MRDNKKRGRRRRSCREGPRLKLAGIDCNPAPDAEDRLRRLFTILLRLVVDDPPPPGTDPSPDGGGQGEN